ncbi:hypothetical protein BE08_23280 [Sorangium cellulosum]|uniref:DUF4345 domain-containing protein n=1 Tax=Sorangium cellulosum TaxID=56 RepID=A0A150PSA2_SORCE|nr:hypothetical protein BE08_23280 [Sorangium cellulosum]
MTAPEVATMRVSRRAASVQRSRVVTVVLFIAGLVLLGIGGATLLAPVAFHATNGVELGDSRSLLSETRAAGGSLLGAGALIMLGAFVSRLTFTATVVAAVTYVSYGLSRLLSMAVDGMPAQGLVLATVVELVIGLSCAASLVWRREGE